MVRESVESGRKGKGGWRKGFAEEPSLEFTRVREDASGDSKYGEDDELPCVIGESEES